MRSNPWQIPTVRQRLRSLRRSAACMQLFAGLWMLIEGAFVVLGILTGDYMLTFVNVMAFIGAAALYFVGVVSFKVFRDDLLDVAAQARAAGVRDSTADF